MAAGITGCLPQEKSHDNEGQKDQYDSRGKTVGDQGREDQNRIRTVGQLCENNRGLKRRLPDHRIGAVRYFFLPCADSVDHTDNSCCYRRQTKKTEILNRHE